jgi:hypothetical membrane protein
MLLTKFGIFNESFNDYFIILFCMTYVFLGVGFLTIKKNENRVAANILAISLILAGLTFSLVWALGRIHGFPLTHPLMTGSAIVFMISILGVMFGGLAYK